MLDESFQVQLLWWFHHSHHDAFLCVCRRRVLSDAVVPHLSAGAVWDQHSIQLLEGTTSLASSIPALRAGISKVSFMLKRPAC